MADGFNSDPDEDYQATLTTLERHRATLKRIEDEYNANQRITPQDLDWFFRITHANFRLIESGENVIRALRKGQSALQLDIVLKDQEIHELRNQ
jgi:hypothetical protein